MLFGDCACKLQPQVTERNLLFMNYAETLGANAKACEKALRCASTEQKNKALAAIKSALTENTEKILSANKADLEAAEKNGMSAAMQDRLRLTPERISGIAAGVEDVIKLDRKSVV